MNYIFNILLSLNCIVLNLWLSRHEIVLHARIIIFTEGDLQLLDISFLDWPSLAIYNYQDAFIIS